MQNQKVENNETAREEIYSPGNVAKMLNVRKAYILRQLRQNKMKGFKMGKFWRVPESALKGFCQTCANNGGGKALISMGLRNKIKFHASLKSNRCLPEAIKRFDESIGQIKAEIPTEDEFKQIASIAKLRAFVTEREEAKQRLAQMPANLNGLALKAYPESAELVGRDPDELEKMFQEEVNAPKKVQPAIEHQEEVNAPEKVQPAIEHQG